MVLPLGWWSTQGFFVLSCWRGCRTEMQHYVLDSTVPYRTLGWIQTSGLGRVGAWRRSPAWNCKAGLQALGVPPCTLPRPSGDVPGAKWAGWEGVGYQGHWPHTGTSVLFESSQLISLLLSDPMHILCLDELHGMHILSLDEFRSDEEHLSIHT